MHYTTNKTKLRNLVASFHFHPGINGLQLEGSYTVQVSQTVNQDTVAALKHLITQQQTSLMARLTARPPPELVPPPAELPATLAAVVVAALTVGQPGAAALPVSLALPGALLGALPGPPAGPTPTARTVVLRGMVERSELTDDGEFADIMEDTREEVTKYGELEEVSKDIAHRMCYTTLPGAC